MPLYVAEGTSPRKLAHIYSVPYLRHCYERLRDSSGSFFVYGHSAGTNHAHICDALFNGGVSIAPVFDAVDVDDVEGNPAPGFHGFEFREACGRCGL
jgi:hypothetical protein